MCILKFIKMILHKMRVSLFYVVFSIILPFGSTKIPCANCNCDYKYINIFVYKIIITILYSWAVIMIAVKFIYNDRFISGFLPVL